MVQATKELHYQKCTLPFVHALNFHISPGKHSFNTKENPTINLGPSEPQIDHALSNFTIFRTTICSHPQWRQGVFLNSFRIKWFYSVWVVARTHDLKPKNFTAKFVHELEMCKALTCHIYQYASNHIDHWNDGKSSTL